MNDFDEANAALESAKMATGDYQFEPDWHDVRQTLNGQEPELSAQEIVARITREAHLRAGCDLDEDGNKINSTANDFAELFVDLQSLIDSGLEPEKPSVCKLWPGTHLFYAGRLNEIHAEPGVGKSNILIASAARVAMAGGTVLYMDPEDTAVAFLRRVQSFAGNDGLRAIVAQGRYLHNPTFEQVKRAQGWALEHRPTLVILDGVAESLASLGLDENSPNDVLHFFREYLRPFAEQAGAAVVASDHVTKNAESRGRFSRGSGAKMGRYDGVVIQAELLEPYTPTKAGSVRLRVAKDRNGGVGAVGAIIADVHFTPREEQDGVKVDFQEPVEKANFKPDVIMDKILRHLVLFGEASKRDLRELGKSQYVDMAIECLLDEGKILRENRGRMHVFKPSPQAQETP